MSTCQRVLEGLPQLSKRINDESIHEKLLSFLSSDECMTLLGQHLEEWNVVTILENCIVEGQDYRVLALTLRLYGRLCKAFPSALLTVYSSTIERYLVDKGQFHLAALVRYSSIEAIRGIICAENGLQRIESAMPLSPFILSSFQDHSIYVRKAASQLLIQLIQLHDDLPDKEIVQHALRDMLYDKNGAEKCLAALECCCLAVEKASPELDQFLTSGRVLDGIASLMQDNDRIVRQKVIDIFEKITTVSEQPLRLLHWGNDAEKQKPLEAALSVFCDRAIVTLTGRNVSEMHCYIQLLNGLHRLSLRLPINSSDREIFRNFCDKLLAFMAKLISPSDDLSRDPCPKIPECLSQSKTQSRMMLLVLLKHCPVLLENASLERRQLVRQCLAKLLWRPATSTDVQILKAALNVLLTLVASNRSHDTSEVVAEVIAIEEIKSCFDLLFYLLDQYNEQTYAALLLLETLGKMIIGLRNDSIARDPVIRKGLMERLDIGLRHKDWDIREEVFRVFQIIWKLGPENRCQAMIIPDMRLDIVQRGLNDEISDVRSAAAVLFKTVRRHIDHCTLNHGLQDFTLSQALPALEDTDASVRRTALEYVLYQLTFDIDQKQSGRSDSGSDWIGKLKPSVMEHLAINDEDWEVRVCACQCLHGFWIFDCVSAGERSASDLFLTMNGDHLLSIMIYDPIRLIRVEAIHTLRNISQQVIPQGNPFQEVQDSRVPPRIVIGDIRLPSVSGKPDPPYIKALRDSLQSITSSINMEHILQSLEPEHLYEEAIEDMDVLKLDDSIMDCE